MSYQQMNDNYRDLSQRGRYEACVREQAAATYSDDPLGKSVLSGDMASIDAVIGAITTGPNWDQLDDDASLLAAVQASWSTVSGAMFPEGA